MVKVIIRPAKAADILALYGNYPKHNMKAYAAELDGKVIAVSGVNYFPDQLVAFSKILPEYQHMKFALAKGTLKVLDLLKRIDAPVYAIADKDIKGSADFLMRCGFEYVARTPEGEVYVWQKP